MGLLRGPEPVLAMRLLVQASLLLEPVRPSVLWSFVVLAHRALRLPLWARPPGAALCWVSQHRARSIPDQQLETT